jgi:hypothetical protein
MPLALRLETERSYAPFTGPPDWTTASSCRNLSLDWTRITHSISILASLDFGDAPVAQGQLNNSPMKISNPEVVTLVRTVHIDARNSTSYGKNVRR